MKHVLTAILSLIIAAVMLTACSGNDSQCREDISVYLHVSLLGLSAPHVNDAGETVRDLLAAMDTVSITGLGHDSLIYADAVQLKQWALPLRQDTTVSAFRILHHGRCDTLYIQHQPTQNFYSLACGCYVTHVLDTVRSTGHIIVDAKILNAAVSTANDIHVQLQFED